MSQGFMRDMKKKVVRAPYSQLVHICMVVIGV